MSQNTVESFPDNSKNGVTLPEPAAISSTKYAFRITQGSWNLIALLLIGIVVGVNLQFAYRFGPNLSVVNFHIVLCVLGFQALMGSGILMLASESGYTSVSLKHKRWIHTVLLLGGSVLALTGNFIMSMSKNINFNSLHGKTSLPATVFTIVCFFNGLASLFSYELRKCLPSNLSKLTHILCGIGAFTMASVSLCYGFDKNIFRNWATHNFTTVLIVFTGVFTAICIINPFITFFSKIVNIVKNK